MNLRRCGAAIGVAALLAGLGATGARADHCRPMLMFSGVTVADQAGPKTNPGVGGCLLVNHEDENVNTNYFVPGANSVSVGVTADPAAGVNGDGTRKSGAVETGSITIVSLDPADGAEVEHVFPLSLTWSGTRWNSPSFTMPGPLVRATAEVLTQPGVVVSVTYRAVGAS